eukprot:3501150-Rhodomonas_salina.3
MPTRVPGGVQIYDYPQRGGNACFNQRRAGAHFDAELYGLFLPSVCISCPISVRLSLVAAVPGYTSWYTFLLSGNTTNTSNRSIRIPRVVAPSFSSNW